MKRIYIAILIASCASLSMAANCYALWERVLDQQECGPIFALVVHEGSLCVGGAFYIPGDPAICYVARLEGSRLYPMGDGIIGIVKSLASYGGKLYAGGQFTVAGNPNAANIASWDGVSWSAVGSVHDELIVHEMAVFDGKLITYSEVHNEIEGPNWDRLYAWDGQSWTFLASAYHEWADGRPTLGGLSVLNGRLYVAGDFNTLYAENGQIIEGNVASWDGELWRFVGDAPFNIYCCGVHYEDLIIGGESGRLQSWDGTNWTSIGPGISNSWRCYSVISHNNYLFAGGHHWWGPGENILMVGPMFGWLPLGSGVDGPVYAMTVYDEALIVAGAFSNAGEVYSPCIAKWIAPAAVGIMIQEFEAAAVAAGVKLSWLIASDERIEGFKIYRSDSEGKDERLITPELLDRSTDNYLDRTAVHGTRYLYMLAVVDNNGREVRSLAKEAGLPAFSAELFQNIPNPFNPVTAIRFTVPEPCAVRIHIYSPSGKLVRALLDASMPAGESEIVWDGRDDAGAPLASGVYFCCYTAGKAAISKKLVLMR